jgi:hypothetical protein
MPTAMFQTQGEAKRFFVQKLIEQAESEDAPLSSAERGMLSWSETDPEWTPTADEATELVAQLASEVSDDEYEASMAELATRAYERDVAADPAARTRWQQAFAKLGEGDHYVSVILEQALGRKLTKGWFT